MMLQSNRITDLIYNDDPATRASKNSPSGRKKLSKNNKIVAENKIICLFFL